MATNFDSFQLRSELLATINSLGWTACTPIQESVIPCVLQGKDVAGLAQTGTGKTGAFLVPLIERILCSMNASATTATPGSESRNYLNWQKKNFILILVPTRELAEQVADQATKLGLSHGIRTEAIYGGVGYDKQKQALADGFEIVVATPGRLIDLYKEHVVDLRQVRAIVFDEADRMFDMGFKDDMKFLLSRIPRDRQFLVFSATLNFDVLNTAYQFGAQPVEFNVSRDQAKAENVQDEIFHVGQDEKPKYLLSILKKHTPRQSIVFSNFKSNVERIAKFLGDNGIPAVGISSLLTQAQRNRVMEQFKDEAHPVNVLVATDVAARGLDIQGVDLVVNFELPDDPENYVHRIGRTGRAGAEGRAFSFVSDRDVDALTRIEEYLQHKVNIGWLEDGEIVAEHKPFPQGTFGEGRPYSAMARGDNRRPREGGGGGRRPRNDNRRGGPGGGRDNRNPRSEERTHAADGPRPDNGGRPHHHRSRDGQRPPREDQRRNGFSRGATGEANRQAHGSHDGANGNGAAPANDSRQHRDRLLGRHGGRDRDNNRRRNEGSSGPRDERGKRPNQSNNGAKFSRKEGSRPSGTNRSANTRGSFGPNRSKGPTAPASLGQKVSGFLKRLFKGT